MSTRIMTLAVIMLTACTRSATAPDPATPNDPPQAPKPANVAGEWIDTTQTQVHVWHVSQADTIATIVDSLYVGSDAIGWTFITCNTPGCSYAAVVSSDTLIVPVPNSDTSVGIVSKSSITFPTSTFVRGAWSPAPQQQHAPPPVTTPLDGTWISDSVATAQCGAGIQQVAFQMSRTADTALTYEGLTFIKLCGEPGWTEYSENEGQLRGGVLPFDQIQPTLPYTGAPGDNWWLNVTSSDTLVDVTPDSLNKGWLPPRFYRVDSLPGTTASSSRLRRPINAAAASRRRRI